MYTTVPLTIWFLAEMKHSILVTLILLLTFSCTNCTTCSSKKLLSVQETLIKCMSSGYNTKSFKTIFTPRSPLYTPLLESTQQNFRFLNSTVLKPVLIVTPLHEAEIQAAVLCSKRQGLQIRVRSGGHDYEGESFLSDTPFVIIDLLNFRAIEINVQDETAWVQSGATLGELYYAIGKKSLVHGFPAGVCPTVGVGGHLSGGGFGTLLRKYGLAADNVVDTYLMDVNGRILNRKAMGEDLFWALRGGGGASFGIILSWKVKLVQVPSIVTVFTVSKKLQEGAMDLVDKWQYIADKLTEDLFIRIILQNVRVDTNTSKLTVKASFEALFLGKTKELLQLMNENFHELGLKEKDCFEMSWIDSTAYFAGFPRGSPPEVLLGKTQLYAGSFKAKSDFVTEPIPKHVLEGMSCRMLQQDLPFVIMEPYGGRMSQILESEAPFPHRKGNLYNIQYLVKWDKQENKHEKWMRKLYRYMKPYVSKSPRGAYINYKDLNLGTNKCANTSYTEASSWGVKYFKDNFKRLVKVKSTVDPDNFFRNKQSIPSIYA